MENGKIRKDGKYNELVFLTPEEYQYRLAFIVEIIKSQILKARKEFKREIGLEYDIVGVIIYGSWARGDPHTQSDLDIITISENTPAELASDFIERLRKSLTKVEIHYFGDITYNNMDGDKIGYWGELLNSDTIVVTPYPQVELTVRSLLDKLNK